MLSAIDDIYPLSQSVLLLQGYEKCREFKITSLRYTGTILSMDLRLYLSRMVDTLRSKDAEILGSRTRR